MTNDASADYLQTQINTAIERMQPAPPPPPQPRPSPSRRCIHCGRAVAPLKTGHACRACRRAGRNTYA